MPCQVVTAPFNIWTREEFDRWVGAATREHVAENVERYDMPPPTEAEIMQIMAMVASEINFNIVPAGNA